MLLSTPGHGSSPHRAAEGIWGQCLLKDRRHGIHGQLSHHTEVLPPQTKSQHVQPGPCGVHLPAQETLTHTCSHLRPSWGDLQRGGPQAAGAMVRKVSTEVSWHCSSVLGASLPRAVTGCESYLAQGSAYYHTTCQNLCHRTCVRLALQQTLICHRWLREGTARCLQQKVSWFWLIKHFKHLPYSAQLSSGQFSHWVMSDSLWPQLLQYARPPWPSPTPRIYSTSCPLSWWCHPTTSSFVVPFSSRLQSFPASGSFQMSQLIVSHGQNIGISASTSVIPMNIQDWFPLGWTGWISLQSKGLSGVFSNTTVQKHQFFCTQLSL